MAKKSKIFIVSGGTGGHIIPARCLASYLSEQGLEVVFFGDEKYRSYIKIEDNFSSKIISSSQLKKSFPGIISAALKISLGTLQSLYFFLNKRPKYLIAFGGYSTFPSLVAAILTNSKIILHEQNSHLGKVNRIFARFASKIALSFVETSGISDLYLYKTVFTGNPIRNEILALNKIPYLLPTQKKQGPKTNNRMGYNVILASDFYPESQEKLNNFFNILVIGGSGGARIFSEVLPKAFFNLSESIKERIQITQQCRRELIHETFNQYRTFNINLTINSFFQNMPELIANSHLIIARAGSSSIFEFCAAKKPMVLIPFAAAADNHQEKNASYLEKHGAAIVLSESEFTINKATDLLRNLIEGEAALEKMSQNAGSLAVLNATKNLSDLLYEKI